MPSFSNRNGCRARNKGTASREHCHITVGVSFLRGPPSLPHPPRMLLPEHQCSSFLFTGEKKKRLRYTPVSVRFGETETASDFGSVCLAEAKSEVHAEAHP
jgi:hypothetical protein